MTPTKQLPQQQQQQQQQLQQQQLPLVAQMGLLLLLLLLLAIGQLTTIAAQPQQQQFLLEPASVGVDQATTATASALSDPSDLSAGLNLVPVSNWIAAAANAEPPAPVQFVRLAMNSGL